MTDFIVKRSSVQTNKCANIIVVAAEQQLHSLLSAHHPISHIMYSRKYWQELNLAIGLQMAIAKVLADFNLAVWYEITIRIYVSKKF